MAPAYRHPEFTFESNTFQEVREELRNRISGLENAEPGGVHSAANAAISEDLRRLLANLRDLEREGIYFGRTDFRDSNDCSEESVYIGRHSFDANGVRIAGWTTPVASLFYRGSEERQELITPRGVTQVELKLLRNLVIKSFQLEDLFDRLDRRDGETLVALSSAQAHLFRQLYSRGDNRLSDIVETIQAEQDQLIRADADKPLVLNGVAGSGKTSIGYHRLAFLLSPENQRDLGLVPERSIVIGPNPYFLSYARGVLPGLELEGITHVTYAQWAMRKMGLIVDGQEGRRYYRLLDRTLDKLLSVRTRPVERQSYLERSKLKGSLRFANVIERLARSAWELKGPWTGCELKSPSTGPQWLTPEDFERAYAQAIARSNGVSSQQRSMTSTLLELVRSKARTKLEVLEPEDRSRISDGWEKGIRQRLRVVWPAWDFYATYYRVMSDHSRLTEVGGDLLSRQEIDQLTSAPRTPERNVDVEDLPALHYLYVLTEGGEKAASFDHIIVDEGQDLSPLHYQVLMQYSSSRGITILGDTAQSIHNYRGISDWQEILPAVGIGAEDVKNITQSYRATSEIVDFNNRLLEGCGLRSEPARAIARSGARPRVVDARTYGRMLYLVAQDVLELMEEYENIAVIVKTDKVLRDVSNALTAAGVGHGVVASDQDEVSAEKVTILPAILAKGVEYQAVLVMDVTARRYDPQGPLDAQLLYVASTRALHHLDHYYHGKPSQFINHLVADFGTSLEPGQN